MNDDTFGPRLDIIRVFGRAPNDPTAWRVQFADGIIANVSVTASSSATINATIVEFGDVFKRLANE
jgi:hypothetical protein